MYVLWTDYLPSGPVRLRTSDPAEHSAYWVLSAYYSAVHGPFWHVMLAWRWHDAS